MKKTIYTLFAMALAACTAESIPETPTTPESTVPTTEKVSINVHLAEPTTKAIINMVERLGGKVVKSGFVMELAGLGAREGALKGYDMDSLIIYPGN